VINAGDGGHKHPTQTLADLLTIRREKGRLCDLTVGFCGDLKYGRTVHSLIEALSRYTGIKLVLISPDELKIPGYVKHEVIRKSGMPYVETDDLESALPELDILYMTRVQKERFADLAVYERLKDSYILTAEKMKLAKEDMSVLHPLPRVNEISVKIDEDPRACYFKQVKNGKYIRMALILTLLRAAEKEQPHPELPPVKRADGKTLFANTHKCRNPRCITVTEQELDQVCRFMDSKNNIYRCVYCDKKIRSEDE
jgi:aspartate carbamoyltransferase catalytic subunit